MAGKFLPLCYLNKYTIFIIFFLVSACSLPQPFQPEMQDKLHLSKPEYIHGLSIGLMGGTQPAEQTLIQKVLCLEWQNMAIPCKVDGTSISGFRITGFAEPTSITLFLFAQQQQLAYFSVPVQSQETLSYLNSIKKNLPQIIKTFSPYLQDLTLPPPTPVTIIDSTLPLVIDAPKTTIHLSLNKKGAFKEDLKPLHDALRFFLYQKGITLEEGTNVPHLHGDIYLKPLENNKFGLALIWTFIQDPATEAVHFTQKQVMPQENFSKLWNNNVNYIAEAVAETVDKIQTNPLR